MTTGTGDRQHDYQEQIRQFLSQTDYLSPQEMKGAVGMRNAIVHDYLNLDWELIQEVITEEKYLKLGQFVRHCCALLLRD